MRFTTLAGLANELQEAEARRELARVVARYARIELLVLDELGYLALPDGAAELVFQVISERNERASLIVTTNLPFGEWRRSSPTPASPKPSSTASPTAPTSSRPAPSPGASNTASPTANDVEHSQHELDHAALPLLRSAYGSAPERQRGAPSAITPKTENPTAGGATSSRRAGATANRRNEQLLDQNGGAPSDDIVVPLSAGDETDLFCLFGLGMRDESSELAWVAETYAGRVPSGLVPFASDSGGNLFLVGGDDVVWFWDHEREGSPDDAVSLHESLEHFLDALADRSGAGSLPCASAREWPQRERSIILDGQVESS